MTCSICGGKYVGVVESDPHVCSSCHLKKVFMDSNDEKPSNTLEFKYGGLYVSQDSWLDNEGSERDQ